MRGLNNADSIQEKNRKSSLCQKIENRKIDTQSKNRKSKIENRKSNFFWSQPVSQILKNRKVENREKPSIFI